MPTDDHSRVALEPNSGYINASYIPVSTLTLLTILCLGRHSKELTVLSIMQGFFATLMRSFIRIHYNE